MESMFAIIAKELKFHLVESAVTLLDEGNTVYVAHCPLQKEGE